MEITPDTALTDEVLLALIAGGENEQVELKGSGARPLELAERICGLANTLGGWIVMGVDDATRQPLGVSSVKYAKDNLVQAARLCQPQIVFDPPTPQILEINGRKLVAVCIPPVSGQLVQAGGVFWSRKGSQTVPLTIEEMAALSFSRGLVSWEEQPAPPPAKLDDLDMKLVDLFLSRRSAHILRHGDAASALIGLKAAVEVAGRGLVPTQAGLLMFSPEPQALLPQAEVDCVQWRSPGTVTVGRGGWLDRRRLSGPLPELIERALDFVVSHIPTSAEIVGAQRVEHPAYPLEAVREAVVNAVVHRDYSVKGHAVRVMVFHDHLEVRSPGLLLPGITIPLLLQGRLLSKTRNPILAGLLRDWPEAQYIERIGAGMRLMLGAVKDAHLPPLGLEEFGGEFVVSFYEPGAGPPPPLEVEPVDRLVDHAPPPLGLADQTDRRLLKLTARQLRALEFASAQGGITNEEYRALNDTNVRMATRELAELRDLGLLVRIGGGNQQRYVLPHPEEP